MPMIELGIGVERDPIAVTLPAIIDSGADATLVPVRYLHQIGATPSRTKWLRGVTGKRVEVEIYSVILHIGEHRLYVPVVGDEFGNEAIVGRDVLNQFIVTLNGLASIVEISQ